MNNFEKATRLRLRFETSRGNLNVEDLWRLPLAELDKLAIALNKQLKESSEESFIKAKSKDNKLLELRFDIVKHIIETLLSEDEEKKKAADKRAKREQLLELIAKKKNQELEGKSLEELEAELTKLED
jgi:uncharacterized protein YabN with tetrapyrrole methylase and pyrophosphatase domain|nr:MAG TPA: hypothetical protein [Bacteriophage sp.]